MITIIHVLKNMADIKRKTTIAEYKLRDNRYML